MFQNLLPASILQKKTFRNRSKGLWKLSASAIFTNLIGASCRQWYIVWSNLIPDECNKNCQMLKNCISYSYCPAWVLTRGNYNHHQKAIQLLEYQMVRALCRFDTLGNLVSSHRPTSDMYPPQFCGGSQAPGGGAAPPVAADSTHQAPVILIQMGGGWVAPPVQQILWYFWQNIGATHPPPICIKITGAW